MFILFVNTAYNYTDTNFHLYIPMYKIAYTGNIFICIWNTMFVQIS